MKELGYEWSILEYNEYFMVKLYQARHQDILDTFNGDAFQKSKLRLSVGSFNVLLAAYLQLNMEKEAIQLIKEAHGRWGVHPDIRDFQRTMHRCMPRNTTIGKKARELISTYAFDNVETLKSNLIHLFNKRMLGDARWIYANIIKNKIKVEDTSVYQVLIKGFLDGKSPRDATMIYDDMRQAGLQPSGAICVSMLAIYAAKRDVAQAEQIIKDTVTGGYPLDELIYNQLIRVYLKSRMANKAFQVFELIQRDPNLTVNDVILNTMIDGLVINKEVEAAKVLYEQMLASHIRPDMVTYNTLLKGFIRIADYSSALDVISDMYKYKCEPDTVTFTTLLDGIFANKQPRTAQEMLDSLHKTGMQPNIYTFNAVISKFIQNHQLTEAEHAIDAMRKPPYNLKPTIHTYTNLLQGYVATNNLTKAMWTFQSILKSDHMRPDRASYHFIICAFMNHDRLDDAITCLVRMRKDKCSPTKDTWGMMLDECIRRRDWNTGAIVVRELEASGTTTALTALPNEILLYILKQFLNLDDLWRLLQVSRTFRIFALHTIYRRWKIELLPESTMKIQCRAALVALEALSCQLSTQTRQHQRDNTNKLFYHLMRREEKLHKRIVLGISSYKHKYVLIEDIDIRNRIRSAVDVIFHHAVFVTAVSRPPIRLACTHASSKNRALAAMMVRLLTRLDVAFPSCCREITFTLADNIKAFLEYTGYKLMSLSKVNKSMTQHEGEIFISACFDLMGAAFIGKILSENHVECAVQRACELLSDSYLRPIKRALLVDLLEGWLTIKRGLVASELCRWVQTEIERCDQQSSTSSSSMTVATATATTMRTTSSLYPPLSDLVSLAHLPLAS
ncbi:hypothetical protein BDC45DRAFT_439532 [Circinella umbellata]|nr:hypothetical protein BDC45DRAFT_439532 [Circinella umbellata]